MTIAIAAVLGGMILNVMPCVLPVLTLKIFHVIEARGLDGTTLRLHGLAYLAGILTTFAFFAAIVVVLKASGTALGWGMQFQSPGFVAVLISVMFVFGLNALGVFEINFAMGDRDTSRGLSGAFLGGILASVMATPCTAPFLSTAAVAALASDVPSWLTITVFLLIGVGLALPFTLVCFVPSVGRWLPRPGAWMETFKHVMGFSLLATAVWLFSVLLKQVTPQSASRFLGVLLMLAVLAWAVQRFAGPGESLRRRVIITLGGSLMVLFVAVNTVNFESMRPFHTVLGSEDVVVDGRINWRPFDPALIDRSLATNRPVFLEFTADWCANCKVNERLFIEVEATRRTLMQTQILPMRADWTNEDPLIQQWLSDLGQAGIPVYVIYMPDGTYDLLPQAITTELLTRRLRAVSRRFPPASFSALPAHDDPEGGASDETPVLPTSPSENGADDT